MGAIIDTLHLGQDEICLIKEKYPEAIIHKQSNSDTIIQKYRVIIQSENWTEDSYYVFLIDSCIAMSSASFCARVDSDSKFAERMRTRISEVAGIHRMN